MAFSLPYLVIGHDVNGPLGGVVGKLAHVESLVDDALACEGCVSVEQQGHDLLALVVSPVELLSAHLALHDGVDGLQVGGVGDDGQADVLVGGAVEALDVCAQVVLHITRALICGFQAYKAKK